MKSIIHFAGIISLISLSATSCSESEVAGPRNQSAASRYFLGLRANSSQIQGVMSSASPSIGGGNIGGRSNRWPKGIRVPSGSAETGTTQAPCASVSVREMANGETIVIMDYGTGCYDEGGIFLKGRLTSSRRKATSIVDQLFTADYSGYNLNEDFGGSFFDGVEEIRWSTSGKTSFSGLYKFDLNTNETNLASASSDTSRYVTGRLSYDYKGAFYGISTAEKSTTSKSAYQFTFDSGDYFRAEVLLPLVIEYSCAFFQPSTSGSPIPPLTNYVSGRERINFSRNGFSGTFDIDYGDGTCDFIITILENGRSFEVDLSKDYVDLIDLVL